MNCWDTIRRAQRKTQRKAGHREKSNTMFARVAETKNLNLKLTNLEMELVFSEDREFHIKIKTIKHNKLENNTGDRKNEQHRHWQVGNTRCPRNPGRVNRDSSDGRDGREGEVAAANVDDPWRRTLIRETHPT